MNPVAPYCGDTQQQTIEVAAALAYKYIDSEEGPWVMMPYASLYPQPVEPETAFLPPPVSRTRLWDAMQTWPL